MWIWESRGKHYCVQQLTHRIFTSSPDRLEFFANLKVLASRRKYTYHHIQQFNWTRKQTLRGHLGLLTPVKQWAEKVGLLYFLGELSLIIRGKLDCCNTTKTKRIGYGTQWSLWGSSNTSMSIIKVHRKLGQFIQKAHTTDEMTTWNS